MGSKTKWDVPLLNGADQMNEALGLLSTDLWAAEVNRLVENTSKFDEWRRIGELRKSCGVKPEMTTVSVRRPPRYLNGK